MFIESRRARRNTGKHKHTTCTELPHVFALAHVHDTELSYDCTKNHEIYVDFKR